MTDKFGRAINRDKTSTNNKTSDVMKELLLEQII